jgi:type I restriction enzyme R subunit
MQQFNKESDFEKALIEALTHNPNQWDKNILKNPSEEDLIANWANILFENNREIDKLNNCRLTDGEMSQIREQITALRTPLRLNRFINGRSVSIKRDNKDDKLHFGKEISLKIYDRKEIAAGQSRYQIVEQPKFPTRGILNDRRGDLMLLINGMPVIHIELKKSGVSVSQAANQIEKYAREGVFTGLFSLIQIFVAMEPNETLYFANPGPEGKFNKDFYFHWADFDNEPKKNWKDIATTLLSIPMAHQLIGFYTVADDTDGVLKVMRSYQYYAANAISDRVSKAKWGEKNQLGGYIWHTTGSGKTMTSFKSAQLIANSKDAEKVIFLVDRIELGIQSSREYRNFKEVTEHIQETEDGTALRTKLKSDDHQDTLIVTSIQKMSNIKDEGGMSAEDLSKMTKKKIVFIVDEAHRSTFGEMLGTIKQTFTDALFFGFTGTPIHMENQIKGNTTADVFGNELHRYSIADGIRDKNVLGFDPYMVLTYEDKKVRKAVALAETKAKTEEEAIADPEKSKVYYKFMDKVTMAGYYDNKKKYIKGIEDYLPKTQYKTNEHRNGIMKDIADNWVTLSHNGKFHAIFATSSIEDAIDYYRLIKKAMPNLKVTALFDPHIDNDEGSKTEIKEKGLEEIILDYNDRYDQHFDMGTHAKFKKDIAARLAHKEPYQGIERTPEKQIDLLIVVDQMLTGFDSKWINTLYMDKILEYQNIIQAFSRTNRLFGPDKPFGTIRYYRKPHSMTRNVEEAVKLYSGDKPIGLFVQKLKFNLLAMNSIFDNIKKIFEDAGYPDFTKNPEDKTACGKFASLFKDLNYVLESAKIQSFTWNKLIYEFKEAKSRKKETVELSFDENTYLILALRYKELFAPSEPGEKVEDIPFDIDGHLTAIDTGKINSDYMNSRFEKFMKLQHLDPKPSEEEIKKALDDLHSTFATLTQEEQKYAGIILHDIERGEVPDYTGKTLRELITYYQIKAKIDQVNKIIEILGLDGDKLKELMKLKLTEDNLNEFGRFEALKNTVDKTKAKTYFEKKENKPLAPSKINIAVDKLLRTFLLVDGFDLDQNPE